MAKLVYPNNYLDIFRDSTDYLEDYADNTKLTNNIAIMIGVFIVHCPMHTCTGSSERCYKVKINSK